MGYQMTPVPNSNAGYEDLLKDLRTVGDLRWTLAFHGPSQIPNVSPESIKEQVLRSEKVADVIKHLLAENPESSPDGSSTTDAATEEDLRFRVRQILDEMGHQYNIKYIRLLGFILIKAVRRMYEHIWVNSEELQDLQPLFAVPDVPVILMPTHRSYADFLLVSFVAFHYGLPLPVIASGIDFLGMAGIGHVLRRAGAFFIRRSFADDILYRTVFSEYIQTIVCQQQPLEFFVEGTRSRSGKSIYPKFGLLQSVVEMFVRGRVSDVMVVPVSITYERTLEENLYARELLGIPKPRESTSGLLKARRVLGDNHGSMWFHMGNGISIRDFLTGKVDRGIYGTVPRNRIVIRNEDTLFVKQLAFVVMREQQANIKIHDWAILATVLLHRIRQKESTFPVSVIIYECCELVNVLRRTAPGHESRHEFTYDSILHCVKIHGNIIRQGADSSFIEFQPESLKTPEVLHMLLAHYRNQLIHRLIPQAVQHLVRKSNWTTGNSFLFLTELFSREFVILSSEDSKNTSAEFSDDDGLKEREESELLSNIVEPFIVAYDIILHVMQSSLFATRSVFRTAKELGILLQQAICKLLDEGAYGGYEILSSDLIANCIQALKGNNALLVREGQLVLHRRVIAELSFQLNTFLSAEMVLRITDAVEKTFGRVTAGAKI